MQNSQPSREMTAKERRAVRKLVISECANFDSEYGCLPLGCDCYMFGKWYTGGFCKWFESTVLPLKPELEASLCHLPVKPCKW